MHLQASACLTLHFAPRASTNSDFSLLLVIATQELAHAVLVLAVVFLVVDNSGLGSFVAAVLGVAVALAGVVGLVIGEVVGLAAVIAGAAFQVGAVIVVGAGVAVGEADAVAFVHEIRPQVGGVHGVGGLLDTVFAGGESFGGAGKAIVAQIEVFAGIEGAGGKGFVDAAGIIQFALEGTHLGGRGLRHSVLGFLF